MILYRVKRIKVELRQIAFERLQPLCFFRVNGRHGAETSGLAVDLTLRDFCVSSCRGCATVGMVFCNSIAEKDSV